MPWIPTPFAGYSCEFSPFRANLLAVSTAQYYGIVGNGRLHIYDLAGPGGAIVPVCDWLTKDGVYDCSWSEANEFVIATAHGDGSVKLYDLTRPQGPILSMEEHTAEVYGVDWNMNVKQLVVSAAWDRLVKVWDVAKGVCVKTYPIHKQIAYAAIWSPARPMTFASVAGDAILQVVDVNAGDLPVMNIQAHQHEILTVDWNKYNEFQVVTGSVDKTIRVFDIRNPSGPLQVLHGHMLAVRRVKTHPHCDSQLVSASYDMSVNVWDLNVGSVIQHFDHHSEFVLGVDWSLFEENLLASASWDRSVCIWNCLLGPPPPAPPGMRQAAIQQPPPKRVP